jgi:predicted ABC-type sugar transport system permease subunit
MKRYVYQNELVWGMIIGLVIWNIGLTFRTAPPKIVTLDMTKVVRSAAQNLAEEVEGDVPEAAKAKLAKRLRSVVLAIAVKHKAIVVETGTIIAGETIDITEDVIKETAR